ncbi:MULTISPECIES: ABC transporter permease [unclassified Microbacterium]|uniref:ABC transporter permease n=1 Tax=unclassified Microbacterium TaxID=2609290 RepID=UPI000C2CD413|nr:MULTISPECIES: ABC transporter permease [unclassified Microbacterium]
MTDLKVQAESGELSLADSTRRRDGFGLLLKYVMVLVLLVVVVIAVAVYPNFFSIENLMLMLRQNTGLGLIAIGATFVIVTGNFDLSVVSVYVLSAAIYASLASTMGWPIALVAAILAALTVGLLNGVLVANVKVSSFIATLATAGLVGGIVLLALGSLNLRVVSEARFWAEPSILGPSIMVLVLILAFVLGQIVLGSTVYGRSLLSVGGNLEASRLAGIRVNGLRITAFLVSAGLAGLAGVFLAANVGSVTPTMIQTEARLTLDAIAIVVIGGTSLFGGEGAIWRTAVGLAVFATLSNIFNSLAVPSAFSDIIKALVLIFAVAADSYARSRRFS